MGDLLSGVFMQLILCGLLQDLGELMQLPKLGKRLHRLIHLFPKVELKASVQPITRSILKVELTITPDFEFNPEIHGTRFVLSFTLFRDGTIPFSIHWVFL